MMTKDKINEVCDFYIETLKDSINPKLEHVLIMLPQIKQFEDIGKKNRWLGFVQGVLCQEKIFSINEMRKHNRMDNCGNKLSNPLKEACNKLLNSLPPPPKPPATVSVVEKPDKSVPLLTPQYLTEGYYPPPPKPPKEPLCRYLRDFDDGPYCPLCNSSFHLIRKGFIGFGQKKSTKCIQIYCDNYYGKI